MRRADAGDAVGSETLERLAAAAPRYNRWMYDRLRPWIGRRVLEIGAGIGTMSAFLADRERLVLTDPEPAYVARLRERFRDRAHVAVTPLRLPVVDGGLAAERLDTVVCLNVLEHVEDDRASLRAIRGVLVAGGRLVLLVPALPAIYGTLDAALGHYRRYAGPELDGKFRAAGFAMRHREYFNLAGIPGWWLTGRVLKRQLLPTGPLRLYDAFVPVFRLERFLPWRVGQSLIAIGEREA